MEQPPKLVPEHLVSDALKKPISPWEEAHHLKDEPVVYTASIDIKSSVPVTNDGG